MNQVDVSIITPTYNRADLLPRVWQSIRHQNASFEWIVIDDGSTDQTAAVMDQLADERIVFSQLHRNCGVNVARNKGVSLARGRYVVFLDSDDELFPDGLNFMISLMNSMPHEVGAAVFTCVMHETGKPIRRYLTDRYERI